MNVVKEDVVMKKEMLKFFERFIKIMEDLIFKMIDCLILFGDGIVIGMRFFVNVLVFNYLSVVVNYYILVWYFI